MTQRILCRTIEVKATAARIRTAELLVCVGGVVFRVDQTAP